MIATLLALAITLPGQYEYAVPDEKDLPTVFELKDGQTIVGFAPLGWKQRQSLTITRDEPWEDPQKRAVLIESRDVKDDYVERPSEWKKRHNENWEQRNYTNVGDESNFYWVPDSEIALAKRASDMSREIVASVAADSQGNAMPGMADAQPAADSPGFLALWGAHIAIVVAALMAGAATVRFVLLR